jgi:hypothetical protein
VKRREFITLLGGAAAWPVATLAQQAGRSYRVALVAGGVSPSGGGGAGPVTVPSPANSFSAASAYRTGWSVLPPSMTWRRLPSNLPLL